MVRRLILSSTVALTAIGGSKPRGPGFQANFAEAGVGVDFFAPPFLRFMVGEGESGVWDGMKEETPAQVFGMADDGTARFMSFSVRKMLPKFRMLRPVDWSSRTVGEPSRMVTRLRSS